MRVSKNCRKKPYLGLRFPSGNRIVMLLLALWAGAFVSGCASGPRYYLADGAGLGSRSSLAVLPLVNFSRYEQAADVVMNSLTVELLGLERFALVDPGLVDALVLEKRIRLTDRLPLGMLRELGELLGVEYLLLGTVNEYDFLQQRNSRVAAVSISLRIVACESGKIYWAATHTRTGDDTETFFGLGRIETLEKLAAVTIAEMVQTLKS